MLTIQRNVQGSKQLNTFAASNWAGRGGIKWPAHSQFYYGHGPDIGHELCWWPQNNISFKKGQRTIKYTIFAVTYCSQAMGHYALLKIRHHLTIILPDIAITDNILWDAAPWNLVVFLRFLTASIIALTMKAVSTTETTVNFYETTRRNIPEDIFVSAGSRISHSIPLLSVITVAQLPNL